MVDPVRFSIQSPDSYYAPWEKSFGRIVTPFEEFIHNQTAGSIILITCTVIALVIANSPLANIYNEVLHTHLTFTIGAYTIDHTIHHWINDGLMALFFFVVGLEIKREVLDGDLANIRSATLPVFAAIGGMVVPAILYSIITRGDPTAIAWGVPMATDIAFAVGVMSLLGNRVPASLFTFVVALAIVDDLGAVAVIAIFYTNQIHMDALMIAGALFGILVIFNLVGIRNPIPAFIVACFLWIAMMESGVHATIAGVLGAWTIPTRPKLEPEKFSGLVRKLLDKFDSLDSGRYSMIRNEQQRGIVQAVESGIHRVESPLQRLEHTWHLPVAFFVIPLFALANAGIPIELDSLGSVLSQPVSLGILGGLILGKLIGVAGVSWLAVKLGIAQLPAGATASQLIGVGLLAGIGFTMSIFIAGLALSDQPDQIINAKTAILVASLIAGIGGYLWLRAVANKPS